MSGNEEILAEIERLKAENAKLKKEIAELERELDFVQAGGKMRRRGRFDDEE